MKPAENLIQKRISAFQNRCREEGLSLTHQRLAVYTHLASTLKHPTAEELYSEIHPEYPTVSLGTVYKTLDTFEQHGLITKSRATGESARYDANLEPHHHLVCRLCGSMQDIQRAPGFPEGAARLHHTNGFLVEEVRIDFRGICGPCRANKK